MKLEDKLGLYLTGAMLLLVITVATIVYGFITVDERAFPPLIFGLVSFIVSQAIIRKHFINEKTV